MGVFQRLMPLDPGIVTIVLGLIGLVNVWLTNRVRVRANDLNEKVQAVHELANGTNSNLLRSNEMATQQIAAMTTAAITAKEAANMAAAVARETALRVSLTASAPVQGPEKKA